MADHHNQQKRIHPLTDVEAPPRSPSPTQPLFPKNTSKSSDDHHRSPSPQQLPQRTFPVSHSKPPKRKRSCLCKFLCWIFSLLLILIVAVGITVGIIYLVFRPKFPKFSIDQLQVVEFNLTGTDSNNLSATFDARITATNPNKKIGIYYEGGSRIESWYEETKLAIGSFPKFYQGHRNTTSLSVLMTGQTQDASGLFTRLQQQQQETGNIPLRLKVKQPVRVKLGKLKLFKVKFRVRCTLIVDSLTSQDGIKIQSSSCKFRGIRL
ncbi:NDR1/HIN1-like protein 6 [Prosopis cineraria]|uniref:NDR1/HIN1-like protein 6 n=1 Tax=Prosopis cineraria TaxID=364024 RepID=UPI00240FE2DD|nr:NDR1/HIN1-like protein 6 [Prosopis cineraria]